MAHDERFYDWLVSMSGTKEGKTIVEQGCLILSRKVEDVSTVVEDIDNDVMVTSVADDGNGNDRVAGYNVKETREKMRGRSDGNAGNCDDVVRHQRTIGRAADV